MGQNFDLYYNLAIGTSALSLLSVLSLVVTVPLLYSQANYEKNMIADKSAKFKVPSNFLKIPTR